MFWRQPRESCKRILFVSFCRLLPVSRAEKVLRVSNPTARQVVRVLQDEGILREITGRTWGRVYLAPSILQAIEGEGGE